MKFRASPTWLDWVSRRLGLRSGYGSKPRVIGERAQLRNALQKIRCTTPIPGSDSSHSTLSEIREIADKALGYKRAYHTHDDYLRPEVMR